ncbi:MAG: class I SAM-dependent methyltransferase [Acidimicrobiia bacterium]|nr:class I SAM-dependent methyltransferase [Acidimicrobiia bacterium]
MSVTATHDHDVPGASRPQVSIEKAPGHVVLARLGKRVLRPGGVEATRHMLDRLGIAAHDDLVELAPGRGATAELALRAGPASYTGVEGDPTWAEHLRVTLGAGGLCDAVAIQAGDARHTGLPPGCASVVYAEAVLTMLSHVHKQTVVGEGVRLLRAGGRLGIHELCLTPSDIADDVAATIRHDLSRAIHVGARPLTTSEWCQILEDAGLEVTDVTTVPMHLLEPRRMLADEGAAGFARVVRNLARDKAARRRVMSMRRVFRAHRDHLAAVTIVAQLPAGR